MPVKIHDILVIMDKPNKQIETAPKDSVDVLDLVARIEGRGVKLGLLKSTFTSEEVKCMRDFMQGAEEELHVFQVQLLDSFMRASFNANYIPPIEPFLQWMDDLGVSRKVVGEYLQKSIADRAKTYPVTEPISYR